MRTLFLFATLVALSLHSMAQAPKGPSISKEQVDRVRASADTTSGEECTKICMDAARQSADLANQYFTDGSVEAAQAMMKESARFAEKAAKSSVESRKREKQTEIALRKLSKHIQDIKETLNFEDRPAVQEVMDRIEAARSVVLEGMFGKPQKELTPEEEKK